MRVQQIGDYYTLQGAAETLGVSYWQLWRAIHQQRVPTLRLGQTTLIRLKDVRGLGTPDPAPGRLEGGATGPMPAYRVRGNMCPECGSYALVYAEGCQKCLACGYSVC